MEFAVSMVFRNSFFCFVQKKAKISASFSLRWGTIILLSLSIIYSTLMLRNHSRYCSFHSQWKRSIAQYVVSCFCVRSRVCVCVSLCVRYSWFGGACVLIYKYYIEVRGRYRSRTEKNTQQKFVEVWPRLLLLLLLLFFGCYTWHLVLRKH